MDLHADKFQLLSIRSTAEVQHSNGSVIEPQADMVYLGALISGDGHPVRELTRRIGNARADFRALSKVWKHSGLSRARKIRIYTSIVLSKLTYGLATTWLNVAERRRLNGFHCRCLREIWGIAPAFLSRVSNARVLQLTQQSPLTQTLAKQQLLLLGKAARAPEGSLFRTSTFCPRTLTPATNRYVRKVGRPRSEWVPHVYRMAVSLTGSAATLERLIESEADWKLFVNSADLQNVV